MKPCRCFGPFWQTRKSPVVIARNALFAGLAAISLSQSSAFARRKRGLLVAALPWTIPTSILAAATVLFFTPARQPGGRAIAVGRARQRRVGEIALPTSQGAVVRIGSFVDEAVLVLSVHAHCGQCSSLIDEADTWRTRGERGVLIAGPASLPARDLQNGSAVVVDETFQAGRTCGAAAAPAALVVAPDGLILKELAEGHEAILRLLVDGEPGF